MHVSLIAVPYYLGHRDLGMGRGPTALLEHGAERVLADAGHDVTTSVIAYDGSVGHEVGAFFAVCRLVAEAVRAARDADRLPIVLAGNCGTAVGTVAGLGEDHLGVVWLDAHGDFHTPDTTGSGFFDGMPLTLVTGGAWRTMLGTVPGFAAIPERHVLLAGVRDLDPGEDERVRHSSLIQADFATLTTKGIAPSLVPGLELLASRVDSLYVHVDADVLHRRLVPASTYSPPGGLMPEQLDEALALIEGRFAVRAASMNCYDPDFDADGQGIAPALRVLVRLASLAAAGGAD